MANVAFVLAGDFEDSEFRVPYDEIKKAGHQVTVLGQERNAELQGYHKKETVKVDDAVAGHNVNEFDALVIPGGYSPDHLRVHQPTVDFVRAFCQAGKIVAAVCHGPQLLIEAGEVKGRRMTSWPSVKTDLQNAGAHWLDEEVVEDGALITSRRPSDLPAFARTIIAALQTGSKEHLEEQAAAARRQSERALTQ